MSFGLDLRVGNTVNLQIGNGQISGQFGNGGQVNGGCGGGPVQGAPPQHHHHCDGSIGPGPANSGYAGGGGRYAGGGSYSDTTTQRVGPCGEVIREQKIHQDGPNGHIDRQITQGIGPGGRFQQEIISYNGGNRGAYPPGGCNCC